MKPFEIAQKYVYGEHDALTDNQEIIDMTKDIEQAIAEQLRLNGVSSMFSAEQMEQAFNDGIESEKQRCGEFNIENY